jgi:hypothetical protein
MRVEVEDNEAIGGRPARRQAGHVYGATPNAYAQSSAPHDLDKAITRRACDACRSRSCS